jgi:hypothetical protein
MLVGFGGLKNHGQMQSVGDYKVDDIDRSIIQELPIIIVAFGNPETPGQLFGPGLVHIHDCGNLHRHALNLPV